MVQVLSWGVALYAVVMKGRWVSQWSCSMVAMVSIFMKVLMLPSTLTVSLGMEGCGRGILSGLKLHALVAVQ